MTTASWSSVTTLDDSHDTSAFETGLPSVDDWFCTKALAEQKAGRVRTHVCLSDDARIAAFFALKHITVNVEGASGKIRATAEAGGAATGLLLAQMGVHRDLQRKGVGKRVIGHAMRMAADLHEQASFRLLVVDAENPGLVPYYGKFGFTPLTNDLRLVMKMSTVHKIVATLK